jgi:soluble lytic murein transglycosylase-like protein
MTGRSRNCRFGTRAALGGMLKRSGGSLTVALLLSGALTAHAGERLTDARVIRSVSYDQPFTREMSAVGRLVGIDPALLRAVVVQESSGNPNAVSEAGAVGLTQLMPVAIRQYRSEAERLLGRPVNARNALDNLLMGACYYRDALRRTHGNVEAAARLYHGGPNFAMHGPRTMAYGKAIAWRYRQITSVSVRPAV